MSDDTPTERFPAPEPSGTDPASTEPLVPQGATEPLRPPVEAPAPTEVLYTPSVAAASTVPPAASAGQAPRVEPDPKSRATLYTLIAVGAALLIAVIIVVIMLLTRGDNGAAPAQSSSPTPSASLSASASPTASPSPSAAPSEEPAPEPEPPVVAGPTFDSFTAQPTAGCAEGDTAKPITFSWSSATATAAYIGVATTDAKAEPYEAGLPPVDTYTLDYQCDQATQVYTVTLEDADGNLAHQTVTIAK